MTTAQTLQLAKTRYVVKPKVTDKEVSTEELLKELDELAEKVTASWQGPADAVAEIREQRGGAL